MTTTLAPIEVVADKEYKRSADRTDYASEYNELNFLIAQKIKQLETSTVVKVIKVKANNQYTGYVDVQPLVQQSSNSGMPYDQPIMFNVPYMRLQGGTNAVIIDPAVGDIGIACFSSRDISTVKNSRKPSLPASERTYDISDGMYIGGILNGTPTQFIQFTGDGINITTPGTVTINGNLTVNGTITNNSINITTHKHSDPQGGITGGPQ